MTSGGDAPRKKTRTLWSEWMWQDAAWKGSHPCHWKTQTRYQDKNKCSFQSWSICPVERGPVAATCIRHCWSTSVRAIQGGNQDVRFGCCSKSPAGLKDVQLLTWHLTSSAWIRTRHFSMMVRKSSEVWLLFFFPWGPWTELQCKCNAAARHLPLDCTGCRALTSSERLPQCDPPPPKRAEKPSGHLKMCLQRIPSANQRFVSFILKGSHRS